MKKKLSLLLLTVILVLSLNMGVFALEFSFQNTTIVPPEGYTEVSASEEEIYAYYQHAGSAELLEYFPVSSSNAKAAAKAYMKESVKWGYELVHGLKKAKSDGRNVYYFGLSAVEAGVNEYFIVVYVPNNGRCIRIVKCLYLTGEAGAFPYGKKDAKRLAATVAVG